MRQKLQEEFEALWQQNRKPVIMVTHDIEEAVFLSDRILVMREGTLVAELPREGTTQEMIAAAMMGTAGEVAAMG